MVFFRLCSAALSAYLFTQYLPNPMHYLWRFTSCAYPMSAACEAEMAWYEDLTFHLKIITALVWMGAWLLLEIYLRRQPGLRTPRVLTHLRYGPVAVMIISIAAITATDAFLIQYSRWQIVRYIESDAPLDEGPFLSLHNTYRHWCGNGWAATQYALYGATPAAYIDDPDPMTRARALRASMYVYDWVNEPSDGPSIEVLNKAMADSDPVVRRFAEQYRAEIPIR